jgi:GNAT superfamily N-acetyltransferase
LSEITHFFVSIPHRNRGIGTRLIKLCVSKAKAEGLDLAIGAEPQVHKLLLKLGFQDTVHVDFDLAQWSKDEYSGFGIFRLWGMVLKA